MDIRAFYNLSYGVYIASAWDEGRAVGCVANSAMQITSNPQTIAVSINHDNYTHKCITETGYFALAVLGEQSDPKLIGKFGFRSSKNTDKFEGVPHAVRGKMPVIDDCVCYFSCKVIVKMETATHTVFLGEVFEAENLKQDTPMTYAYYHKVLKGKTAANAPTYIEEKPKTENAQYQCKICKYIYDGETPFEELPSEWECPICGAPKSAFVKIN